MIADDALSRFLHAEILPSLTFKLIYGELDLRGGREMRGPCPIHNGRHDSFVVNSETLDWFCHSACQEGGDAVLFLQRAESLSFREAVFKLADDVHKLDELKQSLKAAAQDDSAPPRRQRPRFRQQRSPEPERYLPTSDVLEFWRCCARVDEISGVRAWLEMKRIDPFAVADADLARAIPADLPLPAWAARGSRSWLDTGHNLIVPMFDSSGSMRSLLARRVVDVDDGVPKSLAPRGATRVGLVLACGLGRQVLASGARPTWWGAEPLRVEICEGEKKFTLRATRHSDAHEHAPACLAVESGAWTYELAARIPDGSSVFVATDPDNAGARYATSIIETLAERIANGAVRVELRQGLSLHAGNGRLYVGVSS